MREPKKKIPRATPSWRRVEQVVRILEQSLDQGATVTHDERLRETVTGTLRQCDVVIRSGPRHRRTVTIVEVQKRAGKVDIQDYEAWIQKREKLGAQHLICVSSAGFTESVEKDALMQGETVRLMTLCEPGHPPSFYRIESIEMIFRNRLSRDVEVSLAGRAHPSTILSSADAVFTCKSLDGLVSIDDIATAFLRTGPRDSHNVEQRGNGEETHRYTIDCRFDDWLTWIHDKGLAIPVECVRVVEHYTAHVSEIPLQLLAYEQRFIDEVLGWVVAALVEVYGQQIPIRIIFTPQENGDYHVRMETPSIASRSGIESAEFGLELGVEGEDIPQMFLHRVSFN